MLIVLTALSVPALSQIKLQDNFPTITIKQENLQIVEDKLGRLTIDDLLQENIQWHDISAKAMEIEAFSESFYWYKLSLSNESAARQHIILAYDYAHSNFVDVYLVSSNGEITHHQAGDNYLFSVRPINSHLPRFPFTLEAGSDYQIVARVQGRAKNFSYLSKIYSQEDYILETSSNDIIFWICVGACFTIVLFNVLVGVSSRKPGYTWLFGIAVFYILIEASIQGEGYQYLWNDSIWINERVLFFSAILRYVMIGMFAMTLLNWKEELPIVYRIFYWTNIALLLVSAWHLISPIHERYQFTLNSLLSIVYLGVMLVCPLIQWKRTKNYSALLFSLSWFFAYFYIVAALIGYKLFNANFFINYNELRFISNIVQMLIFSIAQGLHIDAMRKSEIAAISENKAKSNFLATMSHEIRTPMTGVIGMIDVLENTPLNNNQKNYISVIKTSANNLLTVINDILDYSKIEAGKIVLEKEPLDIERLLFDTIAIFQPLAEKNNIRLTGLVNPNIPLMIVGDAVRIKQVMYNLISNAIKFSSQGSVSVKVFWQKNQRILNIVVRDNGEGISSDKLSRLFSPYEQLGKGSKHHYGGTGLGLNISKRLAEAMNGSIKASSRLGKGSVFKFWFPAEIAAGYAQKYQPLLKNRKLLLITDDKFLSNALSQWVVLWGGELITTGSKEEILPLLKSIDVVLIDTPLTAALKSLISDNRSLHPDLNWIELVPSHNQEDDPLIHHGPGVRMPSRLLDSICESLDIVRDEKLVEVKNDVAQSTSSPRNILVADDNPVNRLLIKKMLESMGHRADIVSDGILACEYFYNTLIGQTQAYHLVLLDYDMPNLDGVSACRKIRELESQAGIKKTPIVALTAHALPEFRQQCAEAGMNEYLTKPFVQVQLHGIIERFT